ncbi:hypothetical protein E0W68_00025 [Flavobacterium salilacus subsp. salilacus]|uniref:hypothetical protein n=1 Tax=Flavobacterium TaxID=237 RepID=UPI00107505EA|nr:MULTISPECIES: hypothetical protein [Flavobacterium]KAF2519666.1 hypothetical protein E0W68_00025 [Flavobacterium salilacus subsp. salilacus]MBE1614448.1 hypothetical protein [Flavobacterium sp. SaA2.13]
MPNLENKFNLGDLVVLKNHQLLYSNTIKGDGKYIPPIMIVKEVLFENKQKKTHDDITGEQIAEKVKYICLYFDDNKSEFIESHLYESVLEKAEALNLGNNTSSFSYKYGERIFFRTQKLELSKKRSSTVTITTTQISKDNEEPTTIERETVQYVVNFATPDFIAIGYKKENSNDLFYNDGKPKRLTCSDFVKVQWYNPIQQKFSENYLPTVCFNSADSSLSNTTHEATHREGQNEN